MFCDRFPDKRLSVKQKEMPLREFHTLEKDEITQSSTKPSQPVQSGHEGNSYIIKQNVDKKKMTWRLHSGVE